MFRSEARKGQFHAQGRGHLGHAMSSGWKMLSVFRQGWLSTGEAFVVQFVLVLGREDLEGPGMGVMI